MQIQSIKNAIQNIPGYSNKDSINFKKTSCIQIKQYHINQEPVVKDEQYRPFMYI